MPSFISRESHRVERAVNSRSICEYHDVRTVNSTPQISAVICTRDRPEMLRRAIASVLANTGVQFELVVIDQSDNAASAEVVESFGESLRYVKSDTRGLSKARNLGARLALAEVVAFTDDDCEVPDGWLRRAVEVMQGQPEAALCYGTVTAAPELQSKHGSVPALQVSHRRLVGGTRPYELFGMGANMVVLRSAFEEIGGFDEMLGAGGQLKSSEDFDLQFRAHRLKRSTLLEPSLQVVHYGFRDRTEWKGLFWRDGVGVGAFFMKHIRLRDWLAAKGFLRLVAIESLRAGKSLVVRRDPGRAFFLGALFVGAARSLRYPVDRQTRRYA